jgi:hypothetical protein
VTYGPGVIAKDRRILDLCHRTPNRLRVLWQTDTKTRVQVDAYFDGGVPVLARMHDERRAACISLAFDIPRGQPG